MAESSPANSATTPGSVQPTTARPKAIRVLRSPRVIGPSLRFSSATYSSTPGTCLTSGLLRASTTTITAMNMTTTIGKAMRNHSRKVIGSLVAFSTRSRPMRLGGLPIGSSNPPTVML